MKILLITRGYPHSRDPQEGCFEMDQAKALASLGHEVYTMSVESRVRPYWRSPGITKVNNDGIISYKIFYFPTAVVRHLISQKLGLYLEALQARKLYDYIVKDVGCFDIVHCHYMYNIYYGTFVLNNNRVPVVGTEHWSVLAKKSLPGWVTTVCSQNYKKLDQLICVSDFLKQQVINAFNIDSLVCGNVLGHEFISREFVQHSKNQPFTYVACGSLIPRKGYDVLIKSFAKMNDDNCRLLIIGEGKERNKLQRLIDSLHLSAKVQLLGKKNKDEIIDILDNSHCFVLSSFSETFGVVAIEAMSRGLPVITTRCGGIDGIIDKSNGLYVDINDVSGMCDAMISIKHNISAYDPDTIRRDCLSKYSPEVIGQKLISIYKSIIKNKIR